MSSTMRHAAPLGFLLTLTFSIGLAHDLALAFHHQPPKTVNDNKVDDDGQSKQHPKIDKDADKDADKVNENAQADNHGNQASRNTDKTCQDELAPLKLTGTFVATETTPIFRQPEEWTKMRIQRVVDHGAHVHQGETLVELDTKKIAIALKELERDVKLGEISVAQAEQSLSLLRKSTSLSLEAAERAEQHATENLKQFLTVGKKARRKSLEFSLQNAENYLLYQKEELKQLEQMYEADDLTEETEEIILKRTRDQVVTAQHYFDRAQIEHDRGLAINLPREQEELETAVQQTAIELERVRTTEPSKIPQAELKLEKVKLEQEKLQARLDQMHEDRESMNITAPMNGIVYYGRYKNGKWSDVSSLEDQLRPGGMLKTNQTFMTIVKARPLTIQCDLPEKHLSQAPAGTQAMVTPTALPDLKLAAEFQSVSAIPVSKGTFRATIHVELTDDANAIMPGMGCTVEIPSAKSCPSDDNQAKHRKVAEESNDDLQDEDADADDEDDEDDEDEGDEGDDEGDDDDDDDDNEEEDDDDNEEEEEEGVVDES